MKNRRLIAAGVLLAGAGVLAAVQYRRVSTEVTPRPLLYLVADTQRELERLPLAMTRVSEQEENRIGEELARSYGLTPEKQGSKDAQRIADYVRRVGYGLSAHARRKGIRYRFFYRDDRGLVNAGAMPGGQIVIGRGLIELMESEDQLAAVLAHEIAHVDRRHCIEKLQYELRSRELGLRGLYRLAQLGVVLYRAGYTKEQEAEADLESLDLMIAAGYSPQAAAEAMRRLSQLMRQPLPQDSPLDELLRIPLQGLGEYFKSHPSPQERLVLLERELAARGADPDAPQKPLFIRSIFFAEQGARLEASGLYEAAIERYTKAVETGPQFEAGWLGMARNNWKIGNAAGAAKAAEEAVKRDPAVLPAWELLARSLSVADAEHAFARFTDLSNQVQVTTPQVLFAMNGERFGLGLTATPNDGLLQAPYQEYLQGMALMHNAEVRKRVAWWFWRNNAHDRALHELESARQKSPTQPGILRMMAWVESDMGNHADALDSLARSTEAQAEVENSILQAVINSRTGLKEQAVAAFQSAAARDPVWMQEAWVRNNFSAEAAKTLLALQQEEARRRALEALRQGKKAPGR